MLVVKVCWGQKHFLSQHFLEGHHFSGLNICWVSTFSEVNFFKIFWGGPKVIEDQIRLRGPNFSGVKHFRRSTFLGGQNFSGVQIVLLLIIIFLGGRNVGVKFC